MRKSDSSITKVKPLPAKTLRRLYATPDDDTDGIAKLMAAQSKIIKK
jgi:hypothetical protein